MNWVEIKGGKYDVQEGTQKKSLCQVEVFCK